MQTPQLVRTSLGIERVEDIENPANIIIRTAANEILRALGY
jgi:hypothetical protein